MIAHLLWHGSAGVWDEVVSAIGAVILLIILVRLIFFDGRKPPGDPPSDADHGPH